ncbi:MAG TPA: hypothetical protein VNG33_17805, partial [Polyangiaceae bacterium]|nr:hypothetical protein [Polyangiaceae bacterium]
PLAADLGCTTQDGVLSPKLCPNHDSDMRFVPFNVALAEPFVYVVGTPNPNDASCDGIDLAFLPQNQPAGWVCVAARAVDNAGNIGISPPLRICVDDAAAQTHPDCATMSMVPPSCTDGCTPPPRGGGGLFK